ncbi:nitrate- and nitrite sensing domain-containing protein [Streptomyces albiaxialis]|uniref:histidine kinase n=1 Tax=Streptomyces albiaxialis TaxID=329523 RepID=A0ABN2VT87_9ACTN
MRNRLLASVALCAVAVLAAGAPTVVAASDDAADAQRLVDDAKLSQRAIALSHSLADERDDIVEYIAAGRTSRGGAGVSEGQRARVDRQAHEIRDAAPAEVRKALKALPKLRQRAIAGRGGALDSYEAYSRTIQALRGVSRDVARGLPERAQDATAGALPDLARALDQASATRGLLRGALAGTGTQRDLASEAQRARAREEGALSDFEEAAGSEARDSYSTTVNGTDVNAAERYLDRLTARPYLTPREHALDADRVDNALSARLAHMRGVQSSLAAAEVKRLEGLRDDDVDALQIRAALVGVCLLLAVGVSVSTARSLARPLSVLRRGSRRLADDPSGEPVAFHGRNDEFADVVRALNALRDSAADTADLRERAARAEGEQDELAVAKAELTERYELLRQERDAVRERLRVSADAAHGTFVHLSLRTLGLVERQLGVIEELEENETDPDRLGTLFKLDHLATRMRRHTENLLLLAGAEHASGHQRAPAPLLDVLRAAVSEIERYERVALGSVPPHTQISGFAADDLSHLMAELLDNAASFSPPETEVRLSGWLLESGEVALSVQDSGIGVGDEQLAELNARLGDPAAQEPPEQGRDGQNVLGMGLYVVARLAARQGLRVRLSKQDEGGLAAVVTVPRALLPDRPAPGTTGGSAATATATSPSTSASVPAPSPAPDAAAALPGSVAEANSNDLPVLRRRRRRASAVDDWPMGPDGTPKDEAETAPEDGPEETTSGTGTGPADAVPADEHTRAEDLAPQAAQGQRAEPDAEAEAEPVPEAEAESVGHEVQHEVGHGHGPEHEGAAGPTTRGTGTAPVPEQAPGAPTTPTTAYTAKGLPKRTPRTSAAGAPTAPRPRRGGTGAEELRRRLGGFQKGAKEGLRDAAAEVAAEENVEEQAGAQVDGGTAEEARK